MDSQENNKELIQYLGRLPKSDRLKKRSYEEDYPHENGFYSNHCMKCHKTFYGHKRRTLCKICKKKLDAQNK